MPPLVRGSLFGVVAGVTLSMLRAQPGLDLFTFPGVDPFASRGVAALGLLAVAFSFGPRSKLLGRGEGVPWMFLGLAAGFLLSGSLLERSWQPTTPLAFFAVLVAGALVMQLVSALPFPVPAEDETEPSRIELVLLALAGTGLAHALVSLWPPLEVLSGGLRDDGTVFLSVGALACALGAAAFGVPLRRAAVRSGWMPLALALVGGAAILGLWAIGPLGDRDAFRILLARYGLDPSYRGMLQYDALIAGRVLIAPGLVLGVALCYARHRRSLAAVLVGAAAGLWLSPFAQDSFGGIVDGASGHSAPRLALFATIVTSLFAAGAAWVGKARLVSVLAIAVGLAAWFSPVRVELVLSPWQRFFARPSLAIDSAAGFLTVEVVQGGAEAALLDRRLVTPRESGRDHDAERLKVSFTVLPPADRGRRDLCVLLVGQLTPFRAYTLGLMGTKRIDRTAPWHASMQRIEDEMFQTPPTQGGEVIPPSLARSRFEEGEYDLVIVPAIEGPPPLCAGLPRGGETPVVVWVDTSRYVAARDFGDEVLFWADPIDGMVLGLLAGPIQERDAIDSFAGGEPLRQPSAITWLGMRDAEREKASRVAAAQRLAAAAEGTGREKLARGLEMHFRAQQENSPWETPEQSTEFDPESLAYLRDATLAGVPGGALRALWESIAETLVGKRAIQEIYEYVAPVAESGDFWPALQRALARADQETLDPAMAAYRLLLVIDDEPGDLDLRIECARVLVQAEDPAEAVRQLEHVLSIQPDRGVGRLLAVAMVRSGHPEGRGRIEALLEADPEDEELLLYLEPGPCPPLEATFDPGGGHEHD